MSDTDELTNRVERAKLDVDHALQLVEEALRVDDDVEMFGEEQRTSAVTAKSLLVYVAQKLGEVAAPPPRARPALRIVQGGRLS